MRLNAGVMFIAVALIAAVTAVPAAGAGGKLYFSPGGHGYGGHYGDPRHFGYSRSHGYSLDYPYDRIYGYGDPRRNPQRLTFGTPYGVKVYPYEKRAVPAVTEPPDERPSTAPAARGLGEPFDGSDRPEVPLRIMSDGKLESGYGGAAPREDGRSRIVDR